MAKLNSAANLREIGHSCISGGNKHIVVLELKKRYNGAIARYFKHCCFPKKNGSVLNDSSHVQFLVLSFEFGPNKVSLSFLTHPENAVGILGWIELGVQFLWFPLWAGQRASWAVQTGQSLIPAQSKQPLWSASLPPSFSNFSNSAKPLSKKDRRNPAKKRNSD